MYTPWNQMHINKTSHTLFSNWRVDCKQLLIFLIVSNILSHFPNLVSKWWFWSNQARHWNTNKKTQQITCNTKHKVSLSVLHTMEWRGNVKGSNTYYVNPPPSYQLFNAWGHCAKHSSLHGLFCLRSSYNTAGSLKIKIYTISLMKLRIQNISTYLSIYIKL